MPWDAMYSFTWRMVNVPKWNTLAASTASASPSMMPSAKCSSVPTPPERDHGDVDRARHRAGEREVEALLGAVAVHAREQDLAGPAPCRLDGPFDGVDARVLAAAVHVGGPLCPQPPATRLASMAHEHRLAAEGDARPA